LPSQAAISTAAVVAIESVRERTVDIFASLFLGDECSVSKWLATILSDLKQFQ
jgi:hypothetical protein